MGKVMVQTMTEYQNGKVDINDEITEILVIIVFFILNLR